MLVLISSNDCGNFWTDGAVSAFEDMQDSMRPSPSVWYAWAGTPDDHGTAKHTAVCASLDEALAQIEVI